MRSPRTPLGALLVVLALAACDSRTSDEPTTVPTASTAGSPILAADILDAVPVVEAKKQEPGREVAVYGRVRKTADGVFQIVDDDVVSYCGKGGEKMDTCPTPWDFCCDDQDLVTKVTLVVDAKDAQGRPVAKDALGIREVDLVAVRGKLLEEDGQLVLDTTGAGWFRRERPKVPDYVKFP